MVAIVGAIALFTILNAGWQFGVHGGELQEAHEAREAAERHAGRLTRELEAVRASLRNCRGGGSSSQEAAQQHWLLEREALLVERDGLARGLQVCRDRIDNQADSPMQSPLAAIVVPENGGRDSANAARTLLSRPHAAREEATASVSSCSQQLESALGHLRRVRGLAKARAVEAQAANARQQVAGQTLATRARLAIKKEAEKMISAQAQVDVAVDLHAAEVAKLATVIGLRVKAEDVKKHFKKELRKAVERQQEEAEIIAGSAEVGVDDSADDIVDAAVDEGGGSAVQGDAALATAVAPCVALVIPFRGRGVHLDLFYKHISRFLEFPEASKLCWSIYIVEQYDAGLFNRGWLFNVGLAMAQLANETFKCLIIQDLDTLAEPGAGVDFASCEVPTQLSSEIECYGWLPPYATNAGGVVTASGEHWYQINGFSNEYVGWGGEDDDMRLRFKASSLLRGTCGSFCNLTDRAFHEGQTDLIRRPARGHGRFICLDEGSHTPRKHGDMGNMQSKLRDMEDGSDRWTLDGLSNLRFDLVRHESRPFPNQAVGAHLHWLKVLPSDGYVRLSPGRLRLVLADGACSAACEKARRCSAVPARVPFTIEELRREVADALGSCLVGVAPTTASLAYWLVDRQIVVTSLSSEAQQGGLDGAGPAISPLGDPGSWALSETLREALHQPADGEPALVIRVVPAASLTRLAAELRADHARSQKPVVDVCTGTYALLDHRLGHKQTVNVGSDDCEQRSWTHERSFKALRQPRSADDQPVCVGEADGVWTARISLNASCAGEALGVNWTHKAIFYIGSDATGRVLCVRHRVEVAEGLQKWSRWQVEPAGRMDDDECVERRGWTNTFSFRSMEDLYDPARTQLCVGEDSYGGLRAQLGSCRGIVSSQIYYAVLRAEHAENVGGKFFCVQHGELGDRIIEGRGSCTGSRANFTTLPGATGQAWCVGYEGNLCRVEPRARCDQHTGSTHSISLREVSLEDVNADLGLLSLGSV